MSRSTAPWIAASLPLVVGAVLGWMFERGIVPNQVLVGTLHVDLATMLFWSGITVTIVAWGIVVLRRQIDQRMRRIQKEAREAQRSAHRRFLRRLDHELKNPLTVIQLGVANLHYPSDQRAEATRTLTRIAQQADRLQHLVEDLRRLAELEEEGIEQTPVDLPTVVEEAVRLTCERPLDSGRGVEISIQQVPWPVGSVSGDRDLLILLFCNLLDNALKFTTDDDHVEIRALEDGRDVVVEIADTGPGIPAQEVPHLFEELYRGTNADSVPGSGLGLALVRRIVALHDGHIEVRSRVGQGTIVVVRLPRASDNEE